MATLLLHSVRPDNGDHEEVILCDTPFHAESMPPVAPPDPDPDNPTIWATDEEERLIDNGVRTVLFTPSGSIYITETMADLKTKLGL